MLARSGLWSASDTRVGAIDEPRAASLVPGGFAGNMRLIRRCRTRKLVRGSLDPGEMRPRDDRLVVSVTAAMDEAAPDIRAWRKRVARIVRRAESQPARGALLLRSDVSELLAELKRLSRSEPAVVLEVLLFLLERLSDVIGELDDGPGFAAGLLPEVVNRIRVVMLHDARTGDGRVDHGTTVGRLLRLWFEDAQGWYQDLDDLLLKVSVTPAGEHTLHSLLTKHIADLPLCFPPPRGASDDLGRALLLAERHRSERLLGELLARMGSFEYSVIVARDHHRRTGDAVDLVTSLARDNRVEDAVIVARKALASPRSFQRQRLRELLDEMVEGVVTDQAREPRQELERMFLSKPSRQRFLALKKSATYEHWPRIRRRVLSHLQKHQRVPALVFQLYLDEGEWMEADGLVVVQPVEPRVLIEGALRVAADRPAMASGWALLAAHHRMATRTSSVYPRVIKDLELVRDLAVSADERGQFERAVARFRTRYARRKKFIALLAEAGL